MRGLADALSSVARASTLEELGASALPALGRSLQACPSFFAESAAPFVESQALAGEQRDELSGYIREFAFEDPLIAAAISECHPVMLLERSVDRRVLRRSRAYQEFHRVHDFEHHMLIRFYGDSLTTRGALSMGFTRGRRQPEFDERDRRVAGLILPVLQGAADRILATRVIARAAPSLTPACTDELTRAEKRVLAALLQGLSNRDMARRLHVSVNTVKTHLQRIFHKLGVRSRAELLARART